MKKGQAAMEFLMTYGWAILVVLIVIAALAYFGILDPANVLPEKCAFPVDFTCSDHRVQEEILQVRIVNSQGRDITINGANFTSSALAGTALCRTLTGGAVPVSSGDEVTLSITGALAGDCAHDPATSSDKKYRYNVYLQYTIAGSNLPHVVKGEVLAKRT